MTKKISKQLWPHCSEDVNSWKYKDCIIGDGENGKKRTVKKYILNPDFKYKHLDPDYPRGNKFEKIPIGVEE